jgi:hypothetical protein
MNFNSFIACGLLLSSMACGQRQPSAEVSAGTQPPPPPLVVPAAPSKPLVAELPARFIASQLYETFAAAADTVLRLSGHSYHLSLHIRLDTLRSLTHITPPDSAKHFAGDTSRGFQGYYTVEMRDSLGHRVGSHAFTKVDFYPTVDPELAISSGVALPQLLSYSAPMKALVYTINFTAPETDWSCDAVLLLDLQGRVRSLSEGYGVGGPAVEVGLAHNGRIVLTGTEILRASGPPLPLQRPRAELRGAMLLNDSMALTVYELNSQKPQPNAFVLNTRTGQIINRFRYDGFFEELGFTIPWHRLPATHIGCCLDDKKGLYLLPEAQPTRTTFRPFTSLTKFKLPQRPSEVVFDLHGHSRTYVLYVDTLAPSSIRYTYERTALD